MGGVTSVMGARVPFFRGLLLGPSPPPPPVTTSSIRNRLVLPLMQASFTSGAVMAVGDWLCQSLCQTASLQDKKQDEKSSHKKGVGIGIDVERSARFGVVGATLHGPWFVFAFRSLNTLFGASRTAASALTKVAAGQVT